MLIKIPFISETVLNSFKNSSELYIHSVFDKGINIKTIDRPVFLGMQDGPSALMIDSKYLPIFKNCEVGSQIVYLDNKLIFEELGLVLDLSSAEMKNYRISDQKVLSYMSEKYIKAIIGYDFMTGLNLNTEDLIDQLIRDFGYDQEKYLDYLFGRGKGLTPTGDDFLLGMIAYHNVQPYLSDDFFSRLEDKLNSNSTTYISENYLRDATKGYFIRDIINLFDSLQQGRNFVARIYEISTYGSSSGIDMLSGIVMGIIMDRETRSINEK